MRQKDPTTVALFETHHAQVTPRLASLERTGPCLRRADQLALLQQGPPPDTSVPPLGQAAGVGPWKTNISVTHEEGRSSIFCMIPFPFDARPCPSIPKGIGRGPKAR